MDSSNNNLRNIAPNNPDFNNRPRLRKIKRPKHHNGPISANKTVENNMGNKNTTPQPHIPDNKINMNKTQSNQAFSSDDIIRMSKQQIGTDLVRTNDTNVYNQNYNNFETSEFNATPDFDDTFTDDETFTYQGEHAGYVNQDNKKILIISCVCILIGLILGKFMFSNKAVVRDGLQGVVTNPEVPKGRSRCGIAEKTQGCVLYIMNPQRSELNGRDFYDLAAQLTGRQRFVIETGNMRYSTTKIKPGNIAQLNIPPLQ